MQKSSASTILARWSGVNSQTASTLLLRRLNSVNTSRRAVQLRPFRLPASGGPTKDAKKDDGRNLFVVRILAQTETMLVFVEDPSAPLRKEVGQSEGEASMDVDKPDEVAVKEKPGHTRWTSCTLGGATQSSPLATPFDAFLQRVLLGGGPSANMSPAGAWIPRSAAISIEGFIVLCSSGAAGSQPDWEVKVGTVMIKGGAANGTTKGILVEATYLPVPFLPPESTFVKDFLTTLFPPQALANGEIEWISVPQDDFYEAGLNTRREGDDEDDFEWTESHSALTYLKVFKKEGLL
ncbi:putative pyruvate dehydrogenase kinase [Pseudohyphozyma bogoriensis]|nr:putative pyruvate dehydrogenase kinase [Pseudohyphozyma bogoriensis]